MTERTHRGYQIEPGARELSNGKWLARARVWRDEQGGVQRWPIEDAGPREFATRSEAEVYALHLAVAWIDQREGET